MKIKNHRNMLNAILGVTLLLASTYVWASKGYNVKYLISSTVALGLIISNLVLATKKKGFEELISEQADERDLYNAMKSSQRTLESTNHICFIGGIISFILYSIIKIDIFLVVGITLVAIIILMFIILLISDHYYEKHN